jgi:hypothetical protein
MLSSATNVAKGDVVKASFVSWFYFKLDGWITIPACHIVTGGYVKTITQNGKEIVMGAWLLPVGRICVIYRWCHIQVDVTRR